MLSKAILRVLFWAAPLFAGSAFAANSDCSGALESVTHRGIFVRLGDGRIFAGLLRGPDPEMLAAKYSVGDQVKLQCASIAAQYVAEDSFTFSSEVKRVEFVRAPSPEEMKTALGSAASRGARNLLSRTAAGVAEPNPHLSGLSMPGADAEVRPGEAVQGLDQLKAAVSSYLSTVPDFVTDETATVYSSALAPVAWQKVRVLQPEVTFTGMRDTRQRLTVDGKVWNGDFATVPGPHPTGGFGDRLRSLFAEGCATFELKGRTTEASKSVLVYGFVTPPDACPGFVIGDSYVFYPAYHGEVFFDPDDKAVLRVDIQTGAMPKAFRAPVVEERISWGFVTIGEGRHLLPVSAERLKSEGGRVYLIRQEFRNHRHFESSSNVTFQ